MKKVYKISEFASLCGISRDTLLHYDAIGLLKPAFVASNRYRYYTINQFDTVNSISILKATGASLKEIAEYLHNPRVDASLALLKSKLQILEQQEQEIRQMKQSLKQTIESLQEGVECKCGQLLIQQLPQQYLIATPTHYTTAPTEQQFMNVIRQHIDYCTQKGLGVKFQTGEILLEQDAKAGRFVESYYFNSIQDYLPDPRLMIKPAGLYAVYYHQGSYTDLTQMYQTFLQLVQQEGYRLCGNLYENDVIDYVSSPNPNRYILKVSAPVEPIAP